MTRKHLLALPILAALFACSNDPVGPTTTTDQHAALVGIVRDSLGNPIPDAQIHLLHRINYNAELADGAYDFETRFLVNAAQTVTAYAVSPAGSLDTVVRAEQLAPGYHLIETSWRHDKNGITRMIVVGQTFTDTSYHITEDVDEHNLIHMMPDAQSDAKGAYSVTRDNLYIGRTVVSPTTQKLDTISSSLSLIVMRPGYHSAFVTFVVKPDSTVSQDIVLRKE